jgi:hypothetical protein
MRSASPIDGFVRSGVPGIRYTLLEALLAGPNRCLEQRVIRIAAHWSWKGSINRVNKRWYNFEWKWLIPDRITLVFYPPLRWVFESSRKS